MATFDRPLRSIFTFVQQSTPTGAVEGDTWYQPGYQRAWQWDGTQWIAFSPVSDPEGYEGIAGYVCGGSGGSSINKIVFRFDTVTPIVSGLSLAVYDQTGVSSDKAGYSGGGTISTTTYTQIQKLLFSDESASVLGTGLSQAKQHSAGFSDGVKGYFCAGGLTYNDTSLTSNTDKLFYSTETISSLSNHMPIAMSSGSSSALSDTVTAGYSMGYRTALGNAFNGCYKVRFSADQTSLLLSTLTVGRVHNAGVYGHIAGFSFGGWNGASSVTTVDKLLFGVESISASASQLTTAWYGAAPVNSRIAGYAMGGGSLGASPVVQKLDFGTEVVASISSSLSFSTLHASGIMNLAR